jgi:molecular chaperone HscB
MEPSSKGHLEKGNQPCHIQAMNLRVQLARLAVSRPQRAIQLPLPSQLRACFQLPSSTPTRHSSSSLSKICPSCGTKLPTTLPVCPKCDYIAKFQHSITYHELLGLPYEPNPFVVDSALLKHRYIEAQRICHPDAWVTKSEVINPFQCVNYLLTATKGPEECGA